MSHAMRMAEDPAEAEAAVSRAIQIQPNDADYWTELGWLSFERGDHGAAFRCARKACEIDPDNSRASTLRAAAETQVPPSDGGTRGDPRAQIDSLRRTLEIDPDNDAALHNIGVVYFNELRDYRSAERHFRGALAISPDEKLYQRNLARALRRQDPVSRALYAPWHFFAATLELVGSAWERRWPFFLALPVLPVVFAVTFLVAVFWAIFLWPPAAFYEFLTRTDTMAAAGSIAPDASRRSPLRWPRAARLALFLAAFTAFWLVLVGAFRALAFRGFIAKLLVGFVAAWLLLAVYGVIREWLSARERRSRRRAIDLLDS
jgi:hypothetical protein